MQYEEENISQEELDREADARKQDGDEPADTDEAVVEEEADIQTQKPDKPSPMRPRHFGLLLTVFGAILIILIGALASYYYLTFQQVGRSSEQVVTNVWDETVLATINLVDKFKTVETFDELGADGNTGFETLVSNANRTVRDGIFDVRSQTGLNPDAGTFASKLHSFLDDYSQMLGEMKRIVSRVEDIEEASEMDQMLSYQTAMESSYDELLLASRGYIHANLPRDIFEMPADMLTMLETKLGDASTTADEEKANRQGAETTTTQFVAAWQNRDPDGMSALMTAGAKNEFNKGILEDSSDITSFRIMNTKSTGDSAMEINGKLDKETPDGQPVTEDWRFTLIKTNDKWLIDTWKTV